MRTVSSWDAKTLANPPGFLIITAFGTVNQAVAALKAGADEFLTKPLDLEHFVHVIKRILETRALRREVSGLRKARKDDTFHGMIGDHKSMRNLYQQIERISPTAGPREEDIERAVTFCDGQRIQSAHLPARIRANAPSPIQSTNQTQFPTPPIPMTEMESHYIQHVLKFTEGNKKKAADLLGITRKTLYNKIPKS